MSRTSPTQGTAGHLTVPGVAPPVEPLQPGAPPLAILVDYDGTIALTDVSDTVMAEHVPAIWESEAAAYDAGLMGSRRLMEIEMALVDAPGEALRATAAAQPHDPGFVPFVRRAQAAGVVVEVVSDGFGFFIQPALAALGVGELPVITARTTLEGRRASIAFPNGHPTCHVCGTCKRNRVLEHQAAGHAVVFIGDGESDRYAAGYADLVWAKRSLVRICLEAGWPFRRWTEFSEIDAWLEETLAAWRADPSSLPGPATRPFFCGPEVWGDGLIDPPPGAWPPPRSSAVDSRRSTRPTEPQAAPPGRASAVDALEHGHVGLDEPGLLVEPPSAHIPTVDVELDADAALLARVRFDLAERGQRVPLPPVCRVHGDVVDEQDPTHWPFLRNEPGRADSLTVLVDHRSQLVAGRCEAFRQEFCVRLRRALHRLGGGPGPGLDFLLRVLGDRGLEPRLVGRLVHRFEPDHRVSSK
jgi:HAD superfamily phosphoserine phosphatase-like hydrolase